MRALELKITRALGSGSASTQHAAPAPEKAQLTLFSPIRTLRS
jgi:hypothetical protein